MRKSLTVIIFLLLSGFSQLLLANPKLVPATPDIPAKAYVLIDQKSGYILASKNMDKHIEPASLTKLMTAYVVFYEIRSGSISLKDQVKISEKAWRMKGSRMFIEVNKRVSVEDLLKGMIIQSGNDASVALAEHVGGSESAFVTLMNKHAESMGLKNTHFVNSTGWPTPNHYTTARDLAHIAMALIRDFPEYYPWYKTKEFTYNNIKQYNRNRLLWLDDSVDGMKTGHTESAGYCLIASAKQGDMRLVSVVLGTPSDSARASASRALLNYGFRFYESFALYKANETLTNMRIWKGKTETLPLGLEQTLYITAPRGTRKKIKANMNIDSMIIAPASKGQTYGTVNVMLGKQQLAQRPLVALKDVPEGGLWRKLADNIALMFK
ncbi:D-alanyl-D-alanine carboxypeptidase [hydrothermal vent metagenome]|uniref:serine-type D-Ala-D-Ala carboxypeptidase n=1 Tax=hydrothermal vent metagenome TaxID=652676 RepID=A0A3B1BR65_9ZZZZ